MWGTEGVHTLYQLSSFRRASFRRGAGLGLAVLAVTLSFVLGGTDERTATAATCPALPCLRVDAVPGGGVDESASVGSTFSADILLEGAGSAVYSYQFVLRYNANVVSAVTPTSFAPSGWDCVLLPPSGRLPEDHTYADGDPATGEAFLGCFGAAGTATAVSNGLVGRVSFFVVGSGTSELRLQNVIVGDGVGIELVSCESPGDVAAGSCTNAAVSTGGTPPPPPPPPGGGNTCTVAVALDGETVLCRDGSRVRFAGVGSPLGADAGTGWATAVTQWFLAGKTITVQTDGQAFDQFGSRWGYALLIGNDGNEYNISALLIYVGMARHIPDGVNNLHNGWLSAAQTWARTACWNMWDGGNPWGAEAGCF